MKALNENIPIETEQIDPQEVKQELLKKYPTKVARKRAKQIIVNKVSEDRKCRKLGPTPGPSPGSSHSEAVPTPVARELSWGLPVT